MPPLQALTWPVTKSAVAHGRRAAPLTAVGIAVGLVAWTAAAAAGVAAVLKASAAAFTMVKLAGAVYLVVLSVHALLAAAGRRPHRMKPRSRCCRAPRSGKGCCPTC